VCTNLSQHVVVDIREHLQGISVMWDNLPARWRVLDAEAEIRRKVSTMIGVEVIPNLALPCYTYG
jgi:hypothetical protein